MKNARKKSSRGRIPWWLSRTIKSVREGRELADHEREYVASALEAIVHFKDDYGRAEDACHARMEAGAKKAAAARKKRWK